MNCKRVKDPKDAIGNEFAEAPDSRMNKMEGMRFNRNRQNTRSFGKFLAINPTQPHI